MKNKLTIFRNILKMTGKEIKKIRENLNLNQTEFGKKVGVSKNTVSNWENNLTEIPKTMLPLLKSLETNGVSINQSITGNHNNLIGGSSAPLSQDKTTIRELENFIQYLKDENLKKELRITKLLEEQEELHKQISKLIDKIK